MIIMIKMKKKILQSGSGVKIDLFYRFIVYFTLFLLVNFFLRGRVLYRIFFLHVKKKNVNSKKNHKLSAHQYDDIFRGASGDFLCIFFFHF